MKFWKMNGAGNDFIILNNMEEQLSREQLPQLARILCQRHLSIGADGLMVVDTPTEGGDYKMLFYNSDGSIGEMCGNGARCICRYGYEIGLAGEIQRVETTAGLVIGQRISQRQYRIRLNDPTVMELDHPLTVDAIRYPASYVELGNPGLPHAVVPYSGLQDADLHQLRELGRAMRFHESLHKGANVNFFEIIGQDEILVRTFERGVEDFTYACGSGTGSLAAVLTLQGKVSGRNVRIHNPGGLLLVDVEADGPHIRNLYLTGPTNLVCQGVVTDEDLAN